MRLGAESGLEWHQVYRTSLVSVLEVVSRRKRLYNSVGRDVRALGRERTSRLRREIPSWTDRERSSQKPAEVQGELWFFDANAPSDFVRRSAQSAQRSTVRLPTLLLILRCGCERQ